jgi:retron-type reverse transcriptase
MPGLCSRSSRSYLGRPRQRKQCGESAEGSAGMDGMSIDEFPEFSRHHWERIRSALERGAYRPAAVLRVMIPKATGGQQQCLWDHGVPNMRQQWVDLHYPEPVGSG